MQSLSQEAELLVKDAQEIVDSIIDEEISLAGQKNLIAQICKNYAWLWRELDKKERE
jgi:predicted metal-dependent enzyme (double-stranded beta helix superfamily)